MAIYELGREDQKIQLARQAQMIGALNDFASFMQKKREMDMQAPVIEAQRNYYNAQANLLNKKIDYSNNGAPGSPVGGIMMTYKDPISGSTYKTQAALDYEKQRDASRSQAVLDRGKQLKDYEQNLRSSAEQPMPADTAGRAQFAENSYKSSSKIRDLLFPDGTPNSFRQDIVTKAIAKKYTKDPEVQNLKRWVFDTLSARGLISSGTTMKDIEWDRLAENYGIDFFSAPESAFSALSENEDYMLGYLKKLRPNAYADFGSQGSGASNTNSPKTKSKDFSGLWS